MMNAAAGIFLAARRKPKLPYDAEVEYLESTGTQWIDTGVIGVAAGMVYEVKYRLNAFSAYTPIFGNYFGESYNCVRIIAQGTNNNFGYATIGGRAAPAVVVPLAVGLDYVASLDVNAHTIKINGTVYTIYSNGDYNDSSIGLFTNRGSGTTTKSKARIYYFRASRTTTVVRDFIPVRFTNELGQSEGAMYDRANPTVGMDPDGSPRTDGLYRNRGTGAFVIGADKAA